MSLYCVISAHCHSSEYELKWHAADCHVGNNAYKNDIEYNDRMTLLMSMTSGEKDLFVKTLYVISVHTQKNDNLQKLQKWHTVDWHIGKWY